MIQVKRGVEFKIIPDCFAVLCRVLEEVYHSQNTFAMITGAGYENYEVGSYHDRGFAWDVRTTNLQYPQNAIYAIRRKLEKDSSCWYLKYEEEKNNEHLHIAYKYDKYPVSPGY